MDTQCCDFKDENDKIDIRRCVMDKDNVLRELKSDINDFLYGRLPGSCSLDKMEMIAVEIHEKIYSAWNEHNGGIEG